MKRVWALISKDWWLTAAFCMVSSLLFFVLQLGAGQPSAEWRDAEPDEVTATFVGDYTCRDLGIVDPKCAKGDLKNQITLPSLQAKVTKKDETNDQ
jgi:hypothetical protein